MTTQETGTVIIEVEDDDETTLRKQRMREFNELVHILFSKPERLILYKILKDYQRRRDVRRLVVGLDLLLRTYVKLELLKYVRYFVWQGHLDEFDKLTQFHMKFHRRRRRRKRKGHLLQIPDHRSEASTSTIGSGRHVKDVRVFTVLREKDEPSLGFCVRGGSEHGLGIYVSEIEDDSAAGKAGIEVGDKILEANNISLRGVASSSAVKVLTGSNRLKLVVQRTRKVPEWRLSREKTSWYDIHDKKLISGEFEECGISHSIRGLDVEVPERRISLKFGKANRGLGFNIRGGREYGLGIYVSKVDRGGPAEKNGVRIGDQIIDVNGIPFENITHAHAVEVLKGKKHLILTLRDMGRFPVYKELYAEYTWSDGHLRQGSSTMSLQDIHVENEVPSRAESVADLFSSRRKPSAIHSEIFLPGEQQPQKAGTSRSSNDNIHLMNTDDDSDSLIDLDQWAQDIQDEDIGRENKAYVNDEDDADKENHIHKTKKKRTYIHKVTRSNQPEIPPDYDTVDDHDNADDIEDHMDDHLQKEYDRPDMIYAKINKRDKRYASTSRLNVISHTDEEKQKSEVNTVYKSVTHVSSQQDSASERSYKGTDNRPSSSNEDLHSVTPSIDGALYSTIRRLSGGSFKNLTGSSLSIFDSNQSTKGSDTSKNFASLEFKVHSEENLHSRRKSVSYADNHNSDSEEEHGAGSYDLTSPYSIPTRNTEEAIFSVQARQTQAAPSSSYDNYGSNIPDENNMDRDALEKRLKELNERQTNIGLQELNTLDRNEDREKEDSSVMQSTDIPAYSTGLTHEWTSEKIDSVNMAMLEEAAEKLLTEDEFKTVKRHIKSYHQSHELGRLVEVLLEILDDPEKLTLIKDVRGVIYSHDKGQFDNMVNHFEIEEAYQKLSMKLHLPLNHKPQKKPRRKLITTEIETPSEVQSADISLHSGEVSNRKYIKGNNIKRKARITRSNAHVQRKQRHIRFTEPLSIQHQNGLNSEDGHFHIKTMARSNKQRDVVSVMKENVEESKVKLTSPKRFTSPQRQGRITEEKSALDEFQYLDLEHLEEGSCIAAFSDSGSHGSGEVEKPPGSVIVHLSKTKKSIGIDFVEEMVGGVTEVKIHKIHPDGAANDDCDIQVGMAILAVDRHKVAGLSLEEVCAIIDTSYVDKQHVSMKLVLRKPNSTNF
ncbi:PDZ domain-containing protein 7-like isoform X3 [Ruditapes philippinarum]|uniref:PDZ domain-containing protein 7-like isoform X3 n=1 Tax=Ruditapes philippinarum TaxID=129788 RepID=UPI00295BBEA8|nr:PDZ domain-containing protein 7-like isoform X3 [Ruditapes philippinarum]